MGLCPFHPEKTPSFNVNPEKQIFHCFGCKTGGDVFRFLSLQKGVSFPEAVSELAEKYSVQLPTRSTEERQQTGIPKSHISKAVLIAQQYFTEQLLSDQGTGAREYLAGRGLGPELIEPFQLGWAPEGWDNLFEYLNSRQVPVKVSEAAGLIKAKTTGRGYYDRLRDRIICTICDSTGKPVGFGGRALKDVEGEAKYLNSPETPIYSKSRVLYGLDRAREEIKNQKTAIVVEGYFDLLALAANGVGNVVAPLGTALTTAQLRLLKGFVDEVIIVFDADYAGRAAAAKTLPPIASLDMEGRVLVLPEGEDPDSFIRKQGRAEFEKLLETAVPLMDFFMDQSLADTPNTLAGKSKVIQSVSEVIKQVKGQHRQDLLRRVLAQRLSVSEDALTLSQEREKIASTAPTKGLVKNMAVDFEMEIIRTILLHPETAEIILKPEIGKLFTGEEAGSIFTALTRQFKEAGSINLPNLLETVKPETADFLSGLAIGKDGIMDEDLQQVSFDYIKKLELRSVKRQEEDLSKEIKRAQESNNAMDLNRLLAEKNRLLKLKTL